MNREMKNVMNRNERKHIYFCSKNEDGKSSSGMRVALGSPSTMGWKKMVHPDLRLYPPQAFQIKLPIHYLCAPLTISGMSDNLIYQGYGVKGY